MSMDDESMLISGVADLDQDCIRSANPDIDPDSRKLK
jgi:hypothetical protein